MKQTKALSHSCFAIFVTESGKIGWFIVYIDLPVMQSFIPQMHRNEVELSPNARVP